MTLRPKKEYQSTFISSHTVYKKLIPDDDYFAKIDQQFDFDFIYDEVKQFYCENNGRPAKDPVQMFKACLVQRLKGLSDPEMENAAKYDIRIKHFLKISIDDYGFDHSTIWVFRERLGSLTFEVIFNKLLSQIKEKGLLNNYATQHIDSMPVLSSASLPSVTCLIYMGIKDLIKSVEQDAQKDMLDITNLSDDKLIHNSKPRPLFKMDNNQRLKAFEKAVKRARDIITYVAENNIDGEQVSMLKEILNENVTDDNKEKQGVKSIKTLVDTDAKLGHKTKKDLIFGYKNHSLVTENGLITSVEITSAAEKDDKQLMALVKKAESNNLKPETINADSAYGYIETFKSAESLDITLNSKFRGLSLDELSIYDLDIDTQTNTVTCQNNISVKLKGKDKLKAEFPLKTCRMCPKANNCKISNSKTVVFHQDFEVAKRAISRQRELEEQNKILREKGEKIKSRLIIENVFAYSQKLGGKSTPYFNFDRTKIHVLVVSTLSNIMKTVRLCVN